MTSFASKFKRQQANRSQIWSANGLKKWFLCQKRKGTKILGNDPWGSSRSLQGSFRSLQRSLIILQEPARILEDPSCSCKDPIDSFRSLQRSLRVLKLPARILEVSAKILEGLQQSCKDPSGPSKDPQGSYSVSERIFLAKWFTDCMSITPEPLICMKKKKQIKIQQQALSVIQLLLYFISWSYNAALKKQKLKTGTICFSSILLRV